MASYLLDFVDYIPIFGHIKGFIQKHYGENQEAATHASLAATRTTAIMAAGAGGFFIGGPYAAAFCGTVVGLEWDLGVIVPSHGKELQGIPKVIDEPTNLKAWVQGTVRVAGDGLTGVCGGKMSEVAKATKLFAIQPAKCKLKTPLKDSEKDRSDSSKSLDSSN
jgi:hypothetical protein